MICWGGVPSDVQKGVFSRREDNWALWSRPGTYRARKKVRNWTNHPNLWRKRRSRTACGSLPAHGWKQNTPKKCTAAATTLSEGWFRYDRASGWVLRGLDASFSAGAVHAVVGGNGCGKSTMLSVLAKTAKLQRGRMVRGRPRLRCCRRTPRPCWLPRRCATS